MQVVLFEESTGTVIMIGIACTPQEEMTLGSREEGTTSSAEKKQS